MINGKRVEGRSYSTDDWRKLTSAQRTAVHRLQLEAKSSNAKKDKSYDSRKLFKTEISSISEAIISGMMKGTSEKGDNADEIY